MSQNIREFSRKFSDVRLSWVDSNSMAAAIMHGIFDPPSTQPKISFARQYYEYGNTCAICMADDKAEIYLAEYGVPGQVWIVRIHSNSQLIHLKL